MNMRRNHVSWMNVSALLIIASVLAACASNGRHESAGAGDQQPPRESLVDMSDVMQAKLVHTQAIVEGLALGDMQQVAANAESLHGLSTRASWMVHDTVTYVAMSERFRETVLALQDSAGSDDADAAVEAYIEVTRTCLDCHRYLQDERRFKDAPGRRTHLLDHLNPEGV